MNKKILMLTLACITGTNSFSDTSSSFKDRPWEFLEYKLISKPEATAKKYFNYMFATSMLGSLSSIAMVIRNEENHDKAQKYIIGYIASTLSIFPGALAINYYKENYLLYDALKKLIANWPKYQQYTPEEFHEMFNELYETYGQNPETLPRKKALKVVKIMREAVMNRNPKKYFNRIISFPSSPPMVIHTRVR